MKLINRVRKSLANLMTPNMEHILRPQSYQPQQVQDSFLFRG